MVLWGTTRPFCTHELVTAKQQKLQESLYTVCCKKEFQQAVWEAATIFPHPQQVDFWSFKLEIGLRVECDVDYLCDIEYLRNDTR